MGNVDNALCWIQKALLGFEPRISCLLDRRFNQLSHRAAFFPGKRDSNKCREEQDATASLRLRGRISPVDLNE